MTELRDYQKIVYQNKIEHQFNVTNIEKEFLFLYGEVAEAFDAYKKGQKVGEELADVAIYLLGLAEILKVDLGYELERKLAINQKRRYQKNSQSYAQRIEEGPQYDK
ncbi:hypothetical protein [Enterococcus sp. HY326]|uniref:hypothetical protein n=1 Tax=Enterococcus sp. HY326 TaxID=2971265 RepID=UPI00223F8083|nr:hypothetical protein [Enterococcus sp. HY326]